MQTNDEDLHSIDYQQERTHHYARMLPMKAIKATQTNYDAVLDNTKRMILIRNDPHNHI